MYSGCTALSCVLVAVDMFVVGGYVYTPCGIESTIVDVFAVWLEL